MIESYAFGRMDVDGRPYTSDLIIFADRINDSWWRKTGHKLCLEDIEDVFKEKPEVLVIGTRNWHWFLRLSESGRGSEKPCSISRDNPCHRKNRKGCSKF